MVKVTLNVKIVRRDLLQFLKISCSEVRKGGFKFLLIMIPKVISFDAVVVLVLVLYLFRLPSEIVHEIVYEMGYLT